jgi:hypothetical protein
MAKSTGDEPPASNEGKRLEFQRSFGGGAVVEPIRVVGALRQVVNVNERLEGELPKLGSGGPSEPQVRHLAPCRPSGTGAACRPLHLLQHRLGVADLELAGLLDV